MTALPLRDFTDAERDRLAAIEAAPAAEEGVRERLEDALDVTLDSLGLSGEVSARACIYLADAALAVLSGPSSDAVLPMCWDLSPGIHVDGEALPQHRCELPHGHGGAHQSSEGNADFPMRWIHRGPGSDAEQAVERCLKLADEHADCCQAVHIGDLRRAVAGD